MPEGPEIKRAAEHLANVLDGQTCDSIFFGLPKLKQYESMLMGQRIKQVKPRGKAMLIYFANNKVIYSHNQLYGKWVLLKTDEAFHSNRQLRIQIHTANGEARLYSASDIEVLDSHAVEQHPFIAKLGPDILDEEVSDEAFRERFRQSRFDMRQLGGLLLDQGFVAGTGNYLRSEILFDQQLHPNTALGQLSEQQRNALADATRLITQRSLSTGGLCLDERQTASLKAEKDDYEYYRFAIFGHETRDCVRCGDKVEKTQIASRRLYFCPSCQKKASNRR